VGIVVLVLVRLADDVPEEDASKDHYYHEVIERRLMDRYCDEIVVMDNLVIG
jgi:hypothetical protein